MRSALGRPWSAASRSAEGLARAACGMLTQHDAAVIDSLSTISVPSIVIAGANDRLFLTATDYMAKQIPGANKVKIAYAGHAVNIDQPAAFNAAVLTFIDRLGSPAAAGPTDLRTE